MTIEVSAPGKLVVLGEYAVLDGAPARIVTTAARACVRVAPLAGGPSRVSCPPVHPAPAPFNWSESGEPRWLMPESASSLTWLGSLLTALRADGWLASDHVAIELDTLAFHRPDGGKLGLGASAALLVALAHASPCRTRPPPGTSDELAALIDLHRRVQQGSGSGVDVAAALIGGTISFRREGERPLAGPHALPADTHLCAVATPDSVSTPAALGYLARWQETAPRTWNDIRSQLGAIAEAGESAASAREFASAVAAYGAALAELEAASGLAIFGPAHDAIGGIAKQHDVAYKPSGAGGDCGIAVSADAERMAAFEQALASAGFPTLPTAPRGAGCQGSITPVSEAAS